MNAWLFLIFAIICEIAGTTLMKLSEGFSKIHFSILMLLFYLGSLIMLSFALKHIEVGVAYAVWSGIGIAFITSIGILFFGESLSVSKILFISLILVSSICLNLTTKIH